MNSIRTYCFVGEHFYQLSEAVKEAEAKASTKLAGLERMTRWLNGQAHEVGLEAHTPRVDVAVSTTSGHTLEHGFYHIITIVVTL